MLQRVEAKDYVDIAELLRSGLRIEAGLGAAKALFGQVFPTADALRAMTYFEGGDLSDVTERNRATLRKAAATAGPVIETELLAYDLVGPVGNDGPSGGGPGGNAPIRGKPTRGSEGRTIGEDHLAGKPHLRSQAASKKDGWGR